MAEKNENTRKVRDYLEYGDVDFRAPYQPDRPVCTTAGEVLDLLTADVTQAVDNLQEANETQQELLEDIMERNEEGLSLDEFLAREYPDSESKEYLVEGAILTCTNSKRDMRMIMDEVKGREYDWGDEELPTEKGPDSTKVYRKLVVTSDKGGSASDKKNATIRDCVADKNILGFGNCDRGPDNPAEMEKLRRYHDKMDGIFVRAEGTCLQLMKLEKEWENYIIDGEYQTFGDDNQSGITMTSMLFCKHGGFIYPVKSGQEPVIEGFEQFLVEPDVNNQEEIKRYMWYFFRNKGLSIECVSGILGNVATECEFNMKKAASNKNYWGLFQWDYKDRKKALETWAKEDDLDINLVSVQCEYAYWEMTNSSFDIFLKSQNLRCSYETFLEAKTEEDAAIIFATFFERCYLGDHGTDENNQMYYEDIQGRVERTEGAVDIRTELEAEEKECFR